MISPKLLDFSPFFFLIFSPLGTADFFMLLEPPGDGYSLLCSKKQPPWHTPSPPSECIRPPHQSGVHYTLAGRWGGGVSVFRKTPDIGLASYSIIPLRRLRRHIIQTHSKYETGIIQYVGNPGSFLPSSILRTQQILDEFLRLFQPVARTTGEADTVSYNI